MRLYNIESTSEDGSHLGTCVRLDQIVLFAVEKSDLLITLRNNPVVTRLHFSTHEQAWKTYQDIKLELLDL
jgi:hypothetical protein